jgi:hypothetical protein
MMKGVNFQFVATNKAAPAMKSFENGLAGIKRQTDAVNKTNSSFMRGMSDNRRAIQNAGYQVADFAVQIAGGQNAMLAFSQQGGQMLQFFGAFGSVAGAALAIAAAVALSMGAMKKEGDVLRKSVDGLTESYGSYTQFAERAARSTNDLSDDFGRFAGDVRNFSNYMRGVQLGKIFEDMKSIVDPLKAPLLGITSAMKQLETAQANVVNSKSIWESSAAEILLFEDAVGIYQDRLDEVTSDMGISAEQAGRLSLAIDNIGKSTGINQMTSAAAEALRIITAMVPAGEALPPVLRDMVTALEEVVRAGAEAGVATDNLRLGVLAVYDGAKMIVDQIRLVGSAADGAIPGIQRMAKAMWDAAMAPVEATKRLAEMSREFSPGGQLEKMYSGRGTPNSSQTSLGKRFDMFGNPIVTSGPTSSSGGGGGDKTNQLAELQKQLTLETQLLGKTEAQKRVINALGTDWQKYSNVVINGLVAQVGQIDAFNKKVAEQQNIADTIKSSFENAFMGVVNGTMKAKDAFKQMAASIISELFRVLVVQRLVGSFSAATGSGSGIVGIIGKALSFDGGGTTGYGARSGGVDGKGGFAAILHPNETVIDHTKGGSADGVTVNQTISFGSGVTRAEVQSMIPKIVEATKTAVLDAKRRGGAYGGAFA